MRLRQLGALLLLLALPGAAEPFFNVSVWLEDAVVEHGGSIWLNCSHTCWDPGARGGLETSLTKTEHKKGSSWMAQELVNIREWVSVVQCYIICNGSITLAYANITTYQSFTAKIIAISAIATVPAMLLGILAWGLARRGRTRRAARPEPGEATPSRTDFEMAQASAEDTPEEGGSLNSAEDASP